MNSKEKNKGTVIILSIILIWTSLLLIYYFSKNKPMAFATSQNEFIKDKLEISKAKITNIDEIILKNTNDSKSTREEIVREEIELEYITKYRINGELLKGTTQVSEEGRNGIQQIILKRTFDETGELINEEQLGAIVVKSSINKVIDIGTAEKKVIENKIAEKSSKVGLSFDIPLNKPSGYSQEQFKKALTDDKDANKIFESNAEYFYLIEQQYNINGLFVAAVGIHESAWGTSKIAQNKHNLFGYGAYDSNPYNGAYSFNDYSECIDLIARVLVKYYINAAGTNIYDGNKASGKYYNGSTLSAVNKKYATDSNWANAVYKYMQYLYGKI